ncbi:MAG: beta-lactamase family protein [Anaerolineales bacterium]|nr:beta-lactamase family protein [Anaerolineales bacterium]
MKTPKHLLLALIILFSFFLAPRAEASPSTRGEKQPPSPSQLDQTSIEPFLDTFFTERMASAHIPGATIVVVKDRQILLTKGYGVANVENQTPVEPAQTIFRAGSVSKLFTATAIMQLVEQGKIDLNAPVSDYLPEIDLESNYDQPVTVINLLTHTGGFDEQLTGMGALTPDGLIPLDEYLAANMPARVMPPGQYTSYSNHGLALAGLIVEKISGLPYAEYIAQNIFAPLGMTSSTFLEPAPADILSRVATGYAYANGAYQPLPLDYLNVAPAGSIYTTAPDMAQFMIAHLNNGSPLLSPITAAEMHTQHFTQNPALPGFAVGFYEHFENGRRAIMHGGDLTGFSSLLFLLPEENTGFFVSVNTSLNPLNGTDIREPLITAFLDEFFPMPADATIPERITLPDLTHFAGKYRYNRYARNTAEKGLPPAALLQITVTANDDGTLTTLPPLGQGEPTKWYPIAPFLFHEVDGDELMAFEEDADGNITHQFMTFGAIPIATEKVPGYESDSFQSLLLVGLLVVFLTVLGWPIAGLFRRITKRQANFTQNEKLARRLAGTVSGLGLVFLLGIIMRMGQVSIAPFAPIPGWFYVLLALPLIVIGLVIWLGAVTLRNWQTGNGSLFGRVHITLIAFAALAFIWFANYWNLLGWKF